MSDDTTTTCAQMDALLSRLELGELTEAERALTQAHLDDCAACRDLQAQYTQLSRLTKALPTPTLDAGRAEAIFAQVILQSGVSCPPSAEALPEILTMDEVARLMRVSLAELEAELEHMPVFEFAGQLRMRRSQLVQWIESREQRSHLRLLTTGTR